MKIFRLLTALLLIGAVVEMKAQFGPQKDMDAKYAKELIKAGAVAPDFKITKFVRYETGEGLEKKNEDFAAEVAAQMNAANK